MEPGSEEVYLKYLQRRHSWALKMFHASKLGQCLCPVLRTSNLLKALWVVTVSVWKNAFQTHTEKKRV